MTVRGAGLVFIPSQKENRVGIYFPTLFYKAAVEAEYYMCHGTMGKSLSTYIHMTF